MKYAQAGKGSSLNVHIIKIPLQSVNNVLNFAACQSNRFLGLILDSQLLYILLFHSYFQHPVPMYQLSRLVFLTFEKFSVSALFGGSNLMRIKHMCTLFKASIMHDRRSFGSHGRL